MRKITSLLLAAALCLQLCVPAFATETTADVLPDDTADTEEEYSEDTLDADEAETSEEETEEASDAVEADTPDDNESAEGKETTDDGSAAEETGEDETETSEPENVEQVDLQDEDEAEDSEEESDVLYNGNEADYNDPQFLQLLEEGFFDENENDGIATVASSYSHNSQFNGYTITKGVDVSKWNGTINWSKVKAAGISFVMIRCGYRAVGDGTLYKDTMFETNIKGALAAGLEVGVYVYSQAITTAEAKAEAKLALQMCADYDITLPIVLDYEYYTPTSGRLATANLSKTQQTKICLAFCDAVDAAGYGAMVYANKSMLVDDTYGQQIADAGYEVWLAQWTSSTTYSGTYTYWQYSDSGSVSGISNSVDVNYRYQLPSPTITQTYCAVTGVRLAWSKVSLADSYNIYRRDSGGTAWTKLGTVSSDTLTWLDTTAVEGKTYEYVVRACDGAVLSTYQRTGTAVTYQPKFSLASATQFSGGVKLTWAASTNYDQYKIYRRVGYSGSWSLVTTISDVSVTSYLDTATFSSGTTYSYTIVGVSDGVKDSYDSYGIQLTWMDAPELVSAASYKTGMRVTWKEVSGVDGYRVYRKESTGWKHIATVSGSSTVTYYDSDASAVGTTYTYTVRAYLGSVLSLYNGAGVSGTRVSTPTLVSAAMSGSGVKVQWKAVTGATEYRVYRKSAGTSWSKITTTASTSYTDTTAVSGTVYTYTVRAVVSGNVSWYDTTGVSGVWLSTPTLSSASSTSTGVKVQWEAVSGAAGYRVYRKTAGGSWKQLATVTGTSYTDTSLTKYNTNYYYTVRAYTTLNGMTWLSGYNSSGVVYHYLATPKLSSVSTASAGLKVSWSSVSGATKYYVYRKTSSSSGWTKMATVTGATTWTDTTAKSGTVYIYTVRAGSANGTSWYDTAGVSGVWLSTPTLSSASSTSTGVKVQWEAVSGAAGYRVYRKTAGGSWKQLATVTGTSYTDTSLTEYNTNYYYTVRAYTTLNGTTCLSGYNSSGVMLHYLAVPQLDEASSNESGITVSWLAVSGATSYRLYRKTDGAKWACIATLDDDCTSYTDTTGVSGTTYYYTVRAQSADGISWYDTAGVSAICQ